MLNTYLCLSIFLSLSIYNYAISDPNKQRKGKGHFYLFLWVENFYYKYKLFWPGWELPYRISNGSEYPGSQLGPRDQESHDIQDVWDRQDTGTEGLAKRCTKVFWF